MKNKINLSTRLGAQSGFMWLDSKPIVRDWIVPIAVSILTSLITALVLRNEYIQGVFM